MITAPSSPVPQGEASAEELRQLFAAQRKAFRQAAPLSHGGRIDALRVLESALLQNEAALVDSLNQDFGKRPRQETQILEVFPVADEIRHIRRHLRAWMRPRSVSANWQTWPSRTRILTQPLGVVGIVGAWNYPVMLTLSPLANVLAAGNHAMIKPSEMAPATAEVISRMISEIFPPDYVTLVTGGPELGAAFCALDFDHIIFTGSARIGKLVMSAAAKTLTPVTLELGGKSPALVHAEYPVALAADRICSAKIWNAGQTCVAPDYALVPCMAKDAFVTESKKSIAKHLPRLVAEADYTRIINRPAWERMNALVEDARERGAEIFCVNAADEDWTAANRVFPPTLVTNVDDDMRVMQEEIFGPILPIVTYDTLEQAIAYINERPRPLALYYFDTDSARIRQVLENTTSGGVTVNDCMFHVVQNNLPFGGIGPSGMGAYRGIEGFRTFSKTKGVFLQSRLMGSLLNRILKPPYTRASELLIRFLIGRPKVRNRHLWWRR